MDQLAASLNSARGSETPTQTTRDRPPHLDRDDSIFSVPEFVVSERLSAISGPLDDSEISSALDIDFTYPEDVPGLYAIRHCKQNEAKSRILEALQIGYDFLKRRALKRAIEFTRSDLVKLHIVDILQDLERLMSRVQVAHNDTAIIGVRPDATYLASIPRKLAAAKNEVQNSLLEDGGTIPSPPIWAKNNSPDDWWNPNDFEVLGACYRHEVELYLKTISRYLPKGKKSKTDESNSLKTPVPTQPDLPSVSEAAPPKKSKKFFNKDYPIGPPIEAISSSLRIGNIMQGSASLAAGAVPGAEDSQTVREPQYPTDRDSNPFRNRSEKDKDSKDGRKDSKRSNKGSGNYQGRLPAGGPPSDSSDSDSEPSDSERKVPPKRIKDNAPRIDHTAPGFVQTNRVPHFDLKLKPESVPQWDGNINTLARWISKVNRISEASTAVHQELGAIVPRRLTHTAETWYYSIPDRTRRKVEANWDTLKKAISDYWMNHAWLESQKIRANQARYREATHSKESPSEYLIRKLDLISLVYDYTDSETIRLVMAEAPDVWQSILNVQFYSTITEFQNAVKFHEETLTRLTPGNAIPTQLPNSGFNSRNPWKRANTNFVGFTPSLKKPEFPKDDKNVSPRRTPESIGARPCRHCGSGMHWDNECRHSRQGERKARTNFVQPSRAEIQAQEDYDALYYDLDSENETEGTNNGTPQPDFCEPLQRSDFPNQHAIPSMNQLEDSSSLEGFNDSSESLGKENSPALDSQSIKVLSHRVAAFSDPKSNKARKDLTTATKPALNRRSRRRLARDVARVRYSSSQELANGQTLIELKRFMSRPPGCSFLGSRATQIPATINATDANHTTVIIDSGSDITLISHKALQELSPTPKIKQGQRINLVQVTGNASISGFVCIDLFFHTSDGPVKISVEAYVVKGMSTPVILGNDFADQYSISVLRIDGGTQLELGESGRRMKVESSTSSPFTDEDGHAFKIKVLNASRGMNSKAVHRKNQAFRKKTRFRTSDRNIRSAIKILVPPQTSVAVPVLANFPTETNVLYVEKVFTTNTNPEDVYAPPDSIITKNSPKIHVANFSTNAITIQTGQILGYGHNPSTWLDRRNKYASIALEGMERHAMMIRTLAEKRTPDLGLGLAPSMNTVTSHVKDLSKSIVTGSTDEDPLAEPPLEGGPKTYEVPEETIDSKRLLEELDINPDLPDHQIRRIQDVIVRNQRAFGLDDRLGHLDANIHIPLKPDVKEISLPPFPCSPANREVIDKQMDKWIQLGVIEPSKSPWAAPAFIVYRNGKPRMVVDYRKLNEIAISDEFPLPRQDEIIQALSGSQWLSTLDALAGFTQLEIEPKEREKLAFRTHRGLWQFVRMPFGYKNGPSIFQRIMQNILAPFLWIFALVYIDDIVIFSLTFEDHLSHLDQVFKAIETSGVTLATTKCHFGYQSLLLLGQKVSRLGLSTHREKVDAILHLDEPRNTHDLQIFLGMMVYFSSYVPFYAWIAAPLFNLLKKESKWHWTELESEAFELCKQVLVNAPVRGYAQVGLPYRLYSDACDFGLAAILQQVQRIQLKDLRGTKAYERCEKAFKAGEPVPSLVVQISKADNDVPPNGPWGATLDETWVYTERVICYWSRILKSAERNYSPTEREALALKEGLIKFQPYIEGETILAITDHAALTWSKTFQNVNRRLLTWGTVFSAYPKLRIVHRAGRVHSNVDPISRLRRRVPIQEGPTVDATQHISLSSDEDPLQNMFSELGHRFEEKLLNVASGLVQAEELQVPDYSHTEYGCLELCVPDGSPYYGDYTTSNSFSVLVGLSPDEVDAWTKAYTSDALFAEVLEASQEDQESQAKYSQYLVKPNGLIYFEDWNGNERLCVPESLRVSVMSEVHNTLTEAAHGGHHKTYNRIASTYYWPRMSRDIKRYVSTCDICQKSKPRRHAPNGLLQPIPIPSQPFEVVSMDFIPELPTSNGFDNILVIVDKLTKYAIFIPTSTTVTEKETAKLFFSHVIAKFGIPRQIISDRDTRWRGDFWKEICSQMGMKRSLTTAYHPQADGQTEILNQGLEISLRAYIGPSRDDWSSHLDGLALSYNSTPHTATGFSPAFLLRGYTPVTGSTLLHATEPITRPSTSSRLRCGAIIEDLTPDKPLRPDADNMVEQFNAERHRAQEALTLSQHFQRRAYNKGRLAFEFEEGDQVLINPHSLALLKTETGRGKKLLMKYDGPFEIIQKLSPVSYRLRMPASYGMHPVLNIAHLERYKASPPEFGERPTKSLNRDDFAALPEYEVESIIAERRKKGRNGRHMLQYLTRFKGYSGDDDEWLTIGQLKNAPEAVSRWKESKLRPKLTG